MKIECQHKKFKLKLKHHFTVSVKLKHQTQTEFTQNQTLKSNV